MRNENSTSCECCTRYAWRRLQASSSINGRSRTTAFFCTQRSHHYPGSWDQARLESSSTSPCKVPWCSFSSRVGSFWLCSPTPSEQDVVDSPKFAGISPSRSWSRGAVASQGRKFRTIPRSRSICCGSSAPFFCSDSSAQRGSSFGAFPDIALNVDAPATRRVAVRTRAGQLRHHVTDPST